jgi:uncharacterized protein YndB with AHSA1/START domain
MTTTPASAKTGSTVRPFTISRTLNAPRELVYRTWTEREHMEWWGPKGVTIQHTEMDFRPGGTFHYCMKTPDGHEMWGRWIIREIDRPQRLVFINSFSDRAGGVTRHPMNPDWPSEILSTITFVEQSGKTLLTIEWIPINATEIENKSFDENRESMQNGWTGTLDRLEENLAKANK